MNLNFLEHHHFRPCGGSHGRSSLSLRLWPLFGICVGLFLCAFSLQAAAQELDLKKTVLYAVEHAPGFDSQRRALEISRLELSNARAALLPSLDFSTSVGAIGTSPEIRTTPWTSGLLLSLTENLYDNGTSWTRLKQARLQEKLAETRFARERDALALNIAQQFFAFELARRLQSAQETQLDLIRQQYRMISAQYKAGMKPRNDFLRFEAQLRRGEIDLISARDRTQTARATLLETIGAPDSDLTKLSFVLPDERLQETIVTPKAAPPLGDHYETRIAEYERAVNALSTDLVRRQYWPQLDIKLNASYGYNNFIQIDSRFYDTRATQASALVVLSYNIWDWGLRRRNVDIARSQETIAGNTIDTRLLSTRTEIQRMMLDLEQLSANDKLSTELLGLEQQSYDFINRQYRVGKVSYLDLTEALSNLLNAKNTFFNTRIDLLVALLRYRYHEGTLYEFVTR